MAWDFSTEPEFQKKLDWVEQFCREEVEPLEFVFPLRRPARATRRCERSSEPLQEVKARACGRSSSTRSSAARVSASSSSACSTRSSAAYGSAPQMFGCRRARHREHGDARRLRHRGAEEAVAGAAAQPGDRGRRTR